MANLPFTQKDWRGDNELINAFKTLEYDIEL